jgi:hypothetical protein
MADLSWFVFAGNMHDLFWRNLLVTGALISTASEKKVGNYEDTVNPVRGKSKMLRFGYSMMFQADTCVGGALTLILSAANDGSLTC